VTLFPGFGEHVSVGPLSGFVEQTWVMLVRFNENNTSTGFWWTGRGWTLAGFCWADKSYCLRILVEATLLLGFGEQVRVVLLLGFGEQAKVIAYKT